MSPKSQRSSKYQLIRLCLTSCPFESQPAVCRVDRSGEASEANETSFFTSYFGHFELFETFLRANLAVRRFFFMSCMPAQSRSCNSFKNFLLLRDFLPESRHTDICLLQNGTHQKFTVAAVATIYHKFVLA